MKIVMIGAGYVGLVTGTCFIGSGNDVARSKQLESRILESVLAVNQTQKNVLLEKLRGYYHGDLDGRVIAVWGSAFKPQTDDVREAPSLLLIDRLLESGAVVRVHDPAALENVRVIYGDRSAYCNHHYDTLEDVDALAIVTEWNEFRNPGF